MYLCFHFFNIIPSRNFFIDFINYGTSSIVSENIISLFYFHCERAIARSPLILGTSESLVLVITIFMANLFVFRDVIRNSSVTISSMVSEKNSSCFVNFLYGTLSKSIESEFSSGLFYFNLLRVKTQSQDLKSR